MRCFTPLQAFLNRQCIFQIHIDKALPSSLSFLKGLSTYFVFLLSSLLHKLIEITRAVSLAIQTYMIVWHLSSLASFVILSRHCCCYSCYPFVNHDLYLLLFFFYLIFRFGFNSLPLPLPFTGKVDFLNQIIFLKTLTISIFLGWGNNSNNINPWFKTTQFQAPPPL